MENEWGSEIEREVKRRINVSVWAYAYEVENDSLVSDEMFDSECLKITLGIDTGNKKMDRFFRKEFTPDTGLWIHKHPQLERIEELYVEYHQL